MREARLLFGGITTRCVTHSAGTRLTCVVEDDDGREIMDDEYGKADSITASVTC